MKKLLPLLISIVLSIPAVASANHPNTRPAGFMENNGQVKDQSSSPNCTVKYLWAAAPGVNIQIRDNGISFDTYHEVADGKDIAFHRMDLNLIGMDPAAELIPENAMDGVTNYFSTGEKECISDLETFGKIVYKNIYKGIDFDVNTAENGLLKYNFTVRNPKEINKIRLEYAGFDDFEMCDGKMVFTLSGKTITEEIPASWMTATGRLIDVAYNIVAQSKNRVVIGFSTKDKVSNAEGDLIIDPLAIREWSTYYGDSLYDKPEGIATDSLGNIFIVGTTQSLDRMASVDAYQSVFSGGNTDVFVARFNQHGLRQWATYYGGSGDDYGRDVDVDSYERLFITGSTTSTDSIGTATCQQPANGGGSDGFIAQFDRHGNFIWDSYIGGSGYEEATACYADNRGNVLVAGNTDAGGFLTNDSLSPLLPYHGLTDAFMAKYNAEGRIVWGSYYGGPGDDYSSDIVVDSLAGWVMVGSTNSTENIAWGPVVQSDFGGGIDGFAVKIDSTGMIEWSTYYGGAGRDSIAGVETVNGDYFFAGKTDSEIADADTSSFQATYGGGGDAFVFSVSTHCGFNWFTYLGGTKYNAASDISRDYAGDIYVTGTTGRDSVLDSDTIIPQPFLSNDFQYFVTKYDIYGNQLFTGSFGGEGDEYGNAIAVYGYTSIYLTGTTLSENEMIKASASESIYQTEKDGAEDGFIARYTQYTSTLPIDIGCDNCGGGGSGAGGNGNDGSDNPGPPPLGICVGDSILIGLNGGALGQGAQWVWYVDTCGGTDNYIGEGAQIWVSPDTTTTYYVRAESVERESACVHKTVHVDYPNTAYASANDSICPGSPLELFGDGGYYYHWFGPEDYTSEDQNPVIDTVQYNQAGTYTLAALTQFGCSDTTMVDVFLLTPPQFSTDVSDVSCYNGSNGSILVTPADTADISIYWSQFGTDTSFVSDLSAGLYTLSVINNVNGCTAGDSILITQPDRLIDSLWTSPAYCDQANGEGHVLISGTHSPFQVNWSPGNQTGNPANTVLPGNHTVLVTDNIGCVDSIAFFIGNIGQFTAVIDPDSVFLEAFATEDIEVYTVPELENLTYLWTPASGLSCADCPNPTLNPDTSTFYTVMVTSEHGCTSSDSLYVHRELPLPNTFVPTVFSPNGDGLNDKLCLLGVRIETFTLRIFDRNGTEVFSTNDLQNCWDGTVNGKPVTGTFLYTLQAKLQEGKEVNESGNISVRR